MSSTSAQTESLFAAAAKLSGEARQAFLDRECAGQEELRGQLEGLLRAHDRVNHAIDRPAVEHDRLVATCGDDAQSVGSIIAGRYKLLEQIGEGGMGTVWVAEQFQPVKRKVALKLIKAGMDSKAVLARFEAERQALALMEHPNIAKVLDGGMTEEGRPYFVMEYVKGVPITEYCDSVKLSVPERLSLFIQVCSAVQHAHQKGIIHRDLKPSNILVAPYDGQPVPKVIDFGLAKALHQRLTERTLYTAHETVIGTPLYMSPEQAQLNNLDVDTRSDVYSLGVLLYELLTGTTPLEKARFKEAAWDEIRRIIREEEPPRPSTRLSSTGTLPYLAASRQTEPVKLTQQLKGELDWIVMRALEKERTRRYETATGLAKDVQRYLSGEAVEACPPTFGYRLRKAYRKHRITMFTGGMIAAALIAGTVVSTWQATRARHAERLALESREEALSAKEETDATINILKDVIERWNPLHRSPGSGSPSIQVVLRESCDSLDRNQDMAPLLRAKVRRVFGEMYMKLHEYESGLRQLEKSYAAIDELKGPDDLDTLQALEIYGNALVAGRKSMDDLKLAERKLQQVHEARARVQGTGHPETLKTLSDSLPEALFYQGDFPRIAELRQQALAAALANPDLGEEHELTSEIRLQLASMLMRSGEQKNLDEARELCQRVIELRERQYPTNDPRTLMAKWRLEIVRGEETDASELVKRIRDLIRQANLGEISDDLSLRLYDSLALYSLMAREHEVADDATSKLLQDAPELYGQGHPLVRRYHGFRAWYLVDAERYSEAEEVAKRIFSADFAALDELEGGWDDSSRRHGYLTFAACILRRQPQDKLTDDDYQQAEEYLRKAEELFANAPKHLGSPSQTRVFMISENLQMWIELYEKWGKPALAERYQDQLKQLKS